MPTLLREDGFRIYFYSHEPNEPAHVHIDKAGASAKIWIETIAVARNQGFKATELRQILRLVERRREYLLDGWHGYFGTSS